MIIQQIDEFVRQSLSSLSPKLNQFKSEFEQELRQALTTILQNVDLVTRHEFAIQVQLLAKLQDRLEKLEKKILALEEPQFLPK